MSCIITILEWMIMQNIFPCRDKHIFGGLSNIRANIKLVHVNSIDDGLR